MSIIILDLASPEVNRGSYCYTPYLLYSAYKADYDATENKNLHPYLWENVTINDLDKLNELEEVESVYASLWSYPQIELALALQRLCNLDIKFFGYEPLIKELGLPLLHLEEETIIKGMKQYPMELSIHRFLHVLLSDCDLHLRNEQNKDKNRQAYPMFTSYGCPRACNFCSASVNTKHKRYILDTQDVFHGIEKLINSGVRAIHFTDEDFFYDPDRAYVILHHIHSLDPDFQVIALGHAHTFLEFYQRVYRNGEVLPGAKCLKLVEIGLETADDAQAKHMNKARGLSAGDWQTIACNELCKVLFLTMTFYPGDCISAMNKTGEFLSKYGLNPNDLCKRIATNGTEAGLGQFYQYYAGCGDYCSIKNSGMVLTDRPMRLLPSYLPSSFLNNLIKVNPDSGKNIDTLFYWTRINGVPDEITKIVWEGLHTDIGTTKIVAEFIYNWPYVQKAQIAIALATMARLNMINQIGK